MAERVRFLSLFVPSLEQARESYARVFGVEPEAPAPPVVEQHPYSPLPPAVFDLGGVKLALFQADNRVTHPGDVGIGVTSDSPDELLARATEVGGQALGAGSLRVFVLPDRHFFEVVAGSDRS